MNIFLLGFMGSGKSTVGQLLAARLKCAFVDLDERIERAEGRTISEIFAADGEPAFRAIETRELRKLLGEARAAPSAVVALGGGVFAQAENRRLLQDSGGLTVFLDCPLEELQRRCHGFEHRPLARDPHAARALFEARLPFYRQAALTVDASGPAEQTAETIASSLP